jgi:hypothetical protein
MIAELMREAGMLSLVFGVLDAAIKLSAEEEHLVGRWWFPVLVSVSIALMICGIWAERTRKEER